MNATGRIGGATGCLSVLGKPASGPIQRAGENVPAALNVSVESGVDDA